MMYRADAENCVVVLDQPAELPDGGELDVHLVEATTDADTQEEQLPTVAEGLATFIGRLKRLRPDLSANHDHYLCGRPKRQ